MTANQTPATLVLNDAGFISAKLPIQATENKKFVKLGEVQYFVPTLESFGLTAPIESISEEDGLPVYADEKMDFLFSALVKQIAIKAKQALQPKSLQLKDGASIAATWAELLAEGKRGGAGQYMAILAELRKAFEAHVRTLGKSEGVQRYLTDAFANPKGIMLADEGNKAKLKAYFEAFVDACEDADLLERGQVHLEKLLAACEVVALDDF